MFPIGCPFQHAPQPESYQKNWPLQGYDWVISTNTFGLVHITLFSVPNGELVVEGQLIAC
jgi:hypothetical protein